MDYLNTCPEIKLRYKNGGIPKTKITKSSDINDFFRKTFDADSIEIHEEFMVAYLNNANETIGWFKVSQGGLTGTVVDVRLIMSNAVKLCCKSIVLAHNHPSGSLKASEPDKHTTKRLQEACRLFDITLLDHIILTKDSYYSMVDNGDIFL